MIITKLALVYVPREIIDYEDSYEAIPVMQAEIKHKSQNGNEVVHYLYYYTDRDRTLPMFFMTARDCLKKLEDMNPLPGHLWDFRDKYVMKSWDSLADADGSPMEAVLQLLTMLDINGTRGSVCCALQPQYALPAHHLFDWDNAEADTAHSLLKTEAGQPTDVAALRLADGVMYHGLQPAEIEAEAFCGGKLLEAVLTPSFRAIGSDAFAACSYLKRVWLPIRCRLDLTAFRDTGTLEIPVKLYYISSV